MGNFNENSNDDIKRELSRVPNSLSDRINNKSFFDNLIGGSLMTDILIYCSNFRMKDLFGNIRFSVDDFCNKMGYNKANLQRKLSKEQLIQLFGKELPSYTASLPGGKEYLHKIESLFEAILFKLAKENIVQPVSMPDGSTRYTSINIIKYFDISDNFETKKRTKRMYSILLSSEIQQLLYTNYNLIELKEYANIPDRKGYKHFYLILARMISIIRYNMQKNNNEPFYKLSIDLLANCFDIKETEARFRKKEVLRYLKRINKHMKNARFKYTTVKGEGEKWAYTVRFEFPDEVLRLFNEEYKAKFTHTYFERLQDLYIETAFPEEGPEKVYRKRQYINSDQLENKKMIDWIFSNEKESEKEILFKKIFLQTYGKTPQEMDIDFNFKNELKSFIDFQSEVSIYNLDDNL